MCVRVCPWQLALQKEGWRQQMDEIRAVRTIEQLLFAPSWSQKWRQKPAPKTGQQYCRKKERLPKLRPRFWDQGPLRAVSSGDSGTFRLFSWQWASQSLIQVSQYIYIHIYKINLQHNLQPQVSGVAPHPGSPLISVLKLLEHAEMTKRWLRSSALKISSNQSWPF